MPSRSSGDCNQAIYTRLRSFFGVPAGRHIMKHQTSVTMDRVHHLFHRSKTGDDDGYPLIHAYAEVCVQAWVAVMNYEVDREWCRAGCRESRASMSCSQSRKPLLSR